MYGKLYILSFSSIPCVIAPATASRLCFRLYRIHCQRHLVVGHPIGYLRPLRLIVFDYVGNRGMEDWTLTLAEKKNKEKTRVAAKLIDGSAMLTVVPLLMVYLRTLWVPSNRDTSRETHTRVQ
jgi:hypothetical protein